ncbi:MAG: hypothetical protein SFV81_25900 [Pirellulaceae bacterium]|nr:hypothetical protein [Pirellulaceae bacterium]
MSSDVTESKSKVVDELAEIMPAFFPSVIDRLDLATGSSSSIEVRDTVLKEHADRMKEAKTKHEKLASEYKTQIDPKCAGSDYREKFVSVRRQFENAKGNFSFSNVDVMSTKLEELKKLHLAAQEEFNQKKIQLNATAEVSALALESLKGRTPASEFDPIELTYSGLKVEINRAEANMDSLRTMDEKLAGLASQIERVRLIIESREKKKREILAKLELVAQPLDSDPSALRNERLAVSGPLSGTIVTDEALKTSELALGTLQTAAVQLVKSIQVQKLKLKEYEAQLKSSLESTSSLLEEAKKLLPASVMEKVVVPPYGEDSEKQLEACALALSTFRRAIGNQLADSKIKDRSTDITECHNLIKSEASSILAEWKRLNALPGQSIPEPLWLSSIKGLPTSVLKGKAPPMKREELLGMSKSLVEARKQMELLQKTGLASASEFEYGKEQVLAKIAPKDPPGIDKVFSKKLGELRNSVTKALEGKFDKRVFDSVEEKANEFVQLYPKAIADAAALVVVNEIRERLNKNWKNVFDGISGQVKTTFELEKKNAEKEANKESVGRNMPRAQELFQKLEERFDDIRSDRRGLMVGTLKSKQLNEELSNRVYDIFGPDMLKKFGGTQGSNKELQTLCSAFQDASTDEVTALEDLFKEGLTKQENVLLTVISSGDGKALRTLATAFSGKSEEAQADRQKLSTLLTDGGLGNKPEILADMLKFDVDSSDSDGASQRTKNVEKLKALAKKFGSEEDAPKLKSVLQDCGFDKAPSTKRPGVFAELLMSESCSVDDLHGFIGTLTETDKQNLKGMMNYGGMGDHPAPVAPLVKQGSLTVLKEVSNAFTNPEDRTKMKSVIASGGMSGDVKQDGKTHEHPDTLSKVFNDGLSASPENLLTFARTFGDFPGQCKTMLDAWNEFSSSNKDLRQPGKQIEQVLRRMTGDGSQAKIAKLQTQFTTTIDRWVPDSKKKSAFRFAPDLASSAAPGELPRPEGLPDDYKLVGNYLCRRHVPKYFSKGDAKAKNTMWPPGTNAEKLTEYLKEVTKGQLPKNADDTMWVDIGDGKMVEVGAVVDNGYGDFAYALNHFHPGEGWPTGAHPLEVVEFSRDEIVGMCEAVGV